MPCGPNEMVWAYETDGDCELWRADELGDWRTVLWWNAAVELPVK
jgi:hypothetical protein